MQAYADPDPESAVDRAFEGLYRRYVKDVYRYTLAVLRNPSDAEDVTQTTFLNAYRAFKSGQVPLKPHHWLIKIAHNACRSRYVRTARRPVEVPLDESLAQVPVADADGMDVRELLVALGRLPFNQRAALVMRELDGRSYREIAETLEVTVPAVETLIFRARRRLRTERSALQALGAVQLPPSLASFFEGGGGAIASGGALLGSGLALKAVLLLAAGVVAGSVGSTGSNATAAAARAPHLTALREPERTAFRAPMPSRAVRVFLAKRAGSAPGDRRATPPSQAARAGGGRGSFLPAGARHLGTIAAPSQPQDAGSAPAGRASLDTPGVAAAAPRASAPSGSTPRPSPPAPPPVAAVQKAVSHPPAPVPVAAPSVPPPPAVPEPIAGAVPPPPPLPKVP